MIYDIYLRETLLPVGYRGKRERQHAATRSMHIRLGVLLFGGIRGTGDCICDSGVFMGMNYLSRRERRRERHKRNLIDFAQAFFMLIFLGLCMYGCVYEASTAMTEQQYHERAIAKLHTPPHIAGYYEYDQFTKINRGK